MEKETEIIAILRTPSGRWFHFEKPHRIFETDQIQHVIPALEEIESLIKTEKSFAVGFLSYEAAPAFDPALECHDSNGFPLLWFALFKEKKEWPDLPDPESSLENNLEWQADLTREAYRKSIDRIKVQLASGATYQVNYTYRLRTPFHGDAYALFHRLQQNMDPPFAAFIKADHFTICSASPELFFELNGWSLVSRPMKGTCPRGMTLEQDRQAAETLRNSSKAQAENVMIVDMIRNDMGRVAKPGSVRVTELCKMEKYPAVWQMTSTVRARTNASVTGIFQALFPCASVTGAPKPRTMKIIRDLEPSPRNIYTGAIGWIGPDRHARFNVAIRTAWIDHQSGIAEFGTGGGIVWDSETESEFQETKDKASLLRRSWPEFRLLETILWKPDQGYFLLERHIGRMRDSAVYFDFEWKEKEIDLALQDLAKKFSQESQRVRLLVDKKGAVVLECNPIGIKEIKEPVRLKICPHPIHSRNVFLHHKTTHRKIYENARAACPGCDDVILWNERGEITETTIYNLAIEWEGRLYTPPAACGLLAGTFRGYLMDQGILNERFMLKTEIGNYRQIFVLNSVREIQRAVIIE